MRGNATESGGCAIIVARLTNGKRLDVYWDKHNGITPINWTRFPSNIYPFSLLWRLLQRGLHGTDIKRRFLWSAAINRTFYARILIVLDHDGHFSREGHEERYNWLNVLSSPLKKLISRRKCLNSNIFFFAGRDKISPNLDFSVSIWNLGNWCTLLRTHGTLLSNFIINPPSISVKAISTEITSLLNAAWKFSVFPIYRAKMIAKESEEITIRNGILRLLHFPPMFQASLTSEFAFLVSKRDILSFSLSKLEAPINLYCSTRMKVRASRRHARNDALFFIREMWTRLSVWLVRDKELKVWILHGLLRIKRNAVGREKVSAARKCK